MRISVTLRHQLPADIGEYAEQKLHLLERHGTNLHEVMITVDRDPNRVPEAWAEIVLHLHHTRLVARCEAAGVREAIDGAIDRADEQVRRRQDRVQSRRGGVGADAEPPIH